MDRDDEARPTGGPARTALVVVGGSPPTDPAPGAPDLVIAADGGLDHALALGLRCDIVVGDLDSASPEALAHARRSGARIERHRTDKDATDLELALELAADGGCDAAVVLGGAPDGRTDHWLANVTVLGGPRWRQMDVDGWLGGTHVVVVTGARRRRLAVTPGQTVTLLALGGDATGVSTSGLAWPLDGDTLDAGSSRGVSNRATASTVEVLAAHGTILVVVPAAEDP